jgi:hypothetical protein
MPNGAPLYQLAKKIYPDGWKEPKPYIRIGPQPGHVLHAVA